MLRTGFFAMKLLILKYDEHLISSQWNNEADPTQWCKLLRTSSKVMALYMDYRLIRKLSHSLLPCIAEFFHHLDHLPYPHAHLPSFMPQPWSLRVLWHQTFLIYGFCSPTFCFSLSTAIFLWCVCSVVRWDTWLHLYGQP